MASHSIRNVATKNIEMSKYFSSNDCLPPTPRFTFGYAAGVLLDLALAPLKILAGLIRADLKVQTFPNFFHCLQIFGSQQQHASQTFGNMVIPRIFQNCSSTLGGGVGYEVEAPPY